MKVNQGGGGSEGGIKGAVHLRRLNGNSQGKRKTTSSYGAKLGVEHNSYSEGARARNLLTRFSRMKIIKHNSLGRVKGGPHRVGGRSGN